MEEDRNALPDSLAACGRVTHLPEKSHKSECHEIFSSVGSVPTLFGFGIQPNYLNVHSRIDEWSLSDDVVSCFVFVARNGEILLPPLYLLS